MAKFKLFTKKKGTAKKSTRKLPAFLRKGKSKGKRKR